MAIFDRFLHEPIGVEQNGMELRVLSVLARQDLDPWDVALQLSRLPVGSAIQSLTALLERRAPGTSSCPDAPTVATRLVALLPAPGPAQPGTPTLPRQASAGLATVAVHRIQVIVGLTLLMLTLRLMLAGMSAPEPGASPPPPMASAEATDTRVSVAERTEPATTQPE